VEPHDYGIHQGLIKLFGCQVAGSSSQKLPNWRSTLGVVELMKMFLCGNVQTFQRFTNPFER
jgi:hypothetical protein